MSLQKKTINGIFWSIFEAIAGNGLTFIVMLVLARILGPSDFGLVALTTVFISISQTFIDSGMTSALIRKNKCSQRDYSTVFYYNLIVSFIFFILIFSTSNYISIYFNQDQLKYIFKILPLIIIINAFGIVHKTILTIQLDFKSHYKSNFFATTISGCIAIYLALNNFGVWSLVIFEISKSLFSVSFFWYLSKWIPSFIFSKNSFNELFNYGYKLLLSGLLNTGFNNLFIIIIAKAYSSLQLGLYKKADEFQALPSKQLNTLISKVSFPVLSKIKEKNSKLYSGYKKLISHVMLISIFTMMFLSSISEPLVLIILGEEWILSAQYLELLCFVGLMYPLHSLNLNLLKVKGSSNIFLKLEIFKKILLLPVFYVAWSYGIFPMIYSLLIFNIVGFFVNSYWTNKLIKLSSFEQIKSFYIPLLISIFIYILIIFFKKFSNFDTYINIILITMIWAFFAISILELTKNKEYKFIKNTLLSKVYNYD